MLNKSENSTQIGASKEPTRTKTTDGTYMPVGLKSSSARTRPASRSRSRSKSGTRKTTVSKRSTAKVYTKKDLEGEKTVKIVEKPQEVETTTTAETLEPIDNNYNLLNSPANIKMSSIVIEQQHLPLLHQSARYELRQRSSPFISKLASTDPHLMRNSTPVQDNKIMKLRLDESFDDQVKRKDAQEVEIQNVGLNPNVEPAQQQEGEELKKTSLSTLLANSSSKVISTVGLLQDWKKYIRFFALFLILISFVTLLYFNKKSYNFVLTGADHAFKSIVQVKSYLTKKFLSS